ncbi:winged helix-turn-helix domain-containing protein, partial [Sutterella seckii]
EARAGLQEWPCGRRGLWWFYLHNSFINYNITVAACQLFCAYVNNLLLFTSSSLTFAKTVSALAAVLLLLFENAPEAQLGRNEELRVTQTELAELLGIDRASLVRAMTILRSAGAIATARGVVKLVSIERLREAAREAQ